MTRHSDGLNPFWKLAFIFKCLTDSIVLDDFKTALDRLVLYKLRKDRMESSYADQASNENRSNRSHDVEMIEDIENSPDSTVSRGMMAIQAGPRRHSSKAMPINITHFDDISLPDLEHFASQHTWR